MRWNWRVGFYVHSALGTDRYPPFSLSPAPTTRRLSRSAYPEQLSRGLIFVKWLLAIPHLIVVGLLVADIMLYPIPALNELGGAVQVAGGYSVINLLVVIAGFFLLITGTHPRVPLRLPDGDQPVDLPHPRLRRAHGRRVPAVPARCRRDRARKERT